VSRGPKLQDSAEKLLRQVHPSFIVAGRPSSQAFRPTKKDEGQLSVSMGSKTTPAQAFELHTRAKGLASAGVWSVTVGDCETFGLDAYEDSVVEPLPDPAHAVVDFAELTDARVRQASQLLARAAICQYTATARE
jgi:hypothetical protein